MKGGMGMAMPTWRDRMMVVERERDELVTRCMALVDERSALELAVHDLRALLRDALERIPIDDAGYPADNRAFVDRAKAALEG